MKNSRRHSRYSCNTPVYLEHSGRREEALVTNVSAGGLHLVGEPHLFSTNPITLGPHLDFFHYRTRGRVVWKRTLSDGRLEVGVEFETLPIWTVALLSKAIRRYLREPKQGYNNRLGLPALA